MLMAVPPEKTCKEQEQIAMEPDELFVIVAILVVVSVLLGVAIS